jgi:hypothetical protein
MNPMLPSEVTTAFTNPILKATAMDWHKIVEHTIEGVLLTCVIAFGVWAWKLIRDLRLKHEITKTLVETTIGGGLLGITTTIRNRSQVEWRVREVFLCTPKQWYQFNPIGEESDTAASFAELYGRTSPRTPEPFPHLSPLSGYEYRLPAAFIAQYEGPTTGLSITIEHKTHSGRWKHLKVQTGAWANRLIQQTMEHYKQESQSGSLSEARARFHLPPT